MPVFNNQLAGAAGSAGGAADGYTIKRSLRFDATATSNLSRTFSSAGNRKKWTWSAWVKRSKLVDNNYVALFTAPAGGGNDGIFFRNNAISLSFGYAGSGIECYTSTTFTDPSAWYHICVSVNTDEGTPADRIKVWVNNKLQTLNQYPGSGATAGIGAADKHHLGLWKSGNSTNYAFDGYMADVHYLDGIAITSPEGVFGNYSSDTGVWDPIEYTGSHTTTGGTTGTLLNYNSNTSLPTYSDQDGNSGTPSVYQMENAFDGNSSTYANMTYNNGKWTRANFAQPITNVTRIDVGWDGEGDVGYNGSVVNSSVGYNGSRQSLTLYNNSGSPITLNNIHMVSQAGNGVCRLYDVTITTTTQSATELTFSSVPAGPNGFHLDFEATTPPTTHPNKYVTQSGGSTPPSNASTLTYNTGNYFGSNQGVTYDAGSVRKFFVQPGSSDPVVKTSDNGTSWTTVFDGSQTWNDPIEVNCRYVYMSSSGNGFGPYFRQPSFVADSSGNNNHWIDGNIHEAQTPATTSHRYWRVVIYDLVSHWPRMSKLYMYDANGTRYTHKNFTSDNCNDQGSVPTNGGVYSADYTNSYNFTNVGIYSTYNGGHRTGRADVYYSDDDNRWTYSFSTVVTNNAQCGERVGTLVETDVFVDSPSNYAADSGNNGGNYATLNPLNKATNSILSNGNLDLYCTTNNEDRLVFSTLGMSSGKWYCEYLMGGSAATHGLSGPAQTQGRYVGQASADQWGYYDNNGKLYNNGSNSNYGASYSAGDIIGIAFDADNGTLKFYKNGSDQGTAATGLTSGPYFFAFGESGYDGSINFGARPFKHTPPSGYKALCTQNLDAPPFEDPKTAFEVKTYNGNGGTQTISLNNSPDLVWIKGTNSNYDHEITSTVMASNKGIASNITDNQFNTVIEPGTDGFYLDGSSLYVNENSNIQYVSWNWDAGTTHVTNQSGGTITPTRLRANPLTGCSVILYSGVGDGGTETLPHGLNAAPEFVAIKNLTSDSTAWAVYHKGAGAGGTFRFDTTVATESTSMFNSQHPSSTVITLKENSNRVNNTDQEYLAMCWTPIDGFSAFGTYEGGDSPFVYCGFQPALVMIKNVDVSGEEMVMYDVKRDPNNVSYQTLYTNSASGNYNGNTNSYPRHIDILSNGFKANTGNPINQSGTHVWAAWAEVPLNYARAR